MKNPAHTWAGYQAQVCAGMMQIMGLRNRTVDLSRWMIDLHAVFVDDNYRHRLL